MCVGGWFDGSPVKAGHKNPCLNSDNGSSDQAWFTSEFFSGAGSPKPVGDMWRLRTSPRPGKALLIPFLPQMSCWNIIMK